MSRGRRLFLAAALLAAVAVGLAYAAYQVSRARCFALAAPAVCRVATTEPVVALTFDDGPTPAGLDALLPELERRGVRATFFLVGAEAAERPDLVRRLVASGHEVGNHSWSHVRMIGRGRGFYDAEIHRTNQALRAAGAEPVLFRPPDGKKLLGLPLALRRHDLKMIMWTVEDPATRDPAAFAQAVTSQVRGGDIILLHPMYADPTARRALPMILGGLAAKGLRPVTVSELLAKAA